MNKDFQLSNFAYAVETSILDNRDVFPKEGNNITVTSNDIFDNEGNSLLKEPIPNGFEFIGANYNDTTGTTVILCRDTNTGEILASCAGTNSYPGETSKDVNNWFDIMCYGISPYGVEVDSIINFFNQMGMYPSRISGHSLGGCIAQLVGLRLDIDIEVYNSAPLYLDRTNVIFWIRDNLYRASLKDVRPEERVAIEEDLKRRTEENKANIDKLMATYTGKCNNFANGKDILTNLSNQWGGHYVSDVQYITSDGDLNIGLIEDLNEGFQQHVPGYMKQHAGFLDDEEVVTHRMQSINNFVDEHRVSSIDIDGDGVVDISRTTYDYNFRNLFNQPSNWHNSYSGVINIDPDTLSNLAMSLDSLSSTLIEEDKGIINKVLNKNQQIIETRDQRINLSGEQIKNLINNDILQSSVDILKSTLQNNEIINADLSSVERRLKNLHFHHTVSSAVRGSGLATEEDKHIRKLCKDIDSIQENLSQVVIEKSICLQYIEEYQQELGRINIVIDDILCKPGTNMPNTLNDFVCDMFGTLGTYLILDLNNIQFLLSNASEMICAINQNFVDKDTTDAQNIFNNILTSIEPYKIDTAGFNGTIDEVAASNQAYVDFASFDDQLDQHLDECLSTLVDDYVNHLRVRLDDLKLQIEYCDNDLAELKTAINQFYNDINLDFGFGYTINAKYFDGSFIPPEKSHYCLISKYMDSTSALLHLYQNVEAIQYQFCAQTHAITSPLIVEGVVNYLLSMLMQAFYQALDYDEQVAAINLIAYDLLALSNQLKTVHNVLVNSQKSVAIDALSTILQEIIDYCVVFNARVAMVFGEYVDKNTDYYPQPEKSDYF